MHIDPMSRLTCLFDPFLPCEGTEQLTSTRKIIEFVWILTELDGSEHEILLVDGLH